MKKFIVVFLSFVFILSMFAVSCKKSNPSTPAPADTATITDTITQTSTLTYTFTHTFSDTPTMDQTQQAEMTATQQAMDATATEEANETATQIAYEAQQTETQAVINITATRVAIDATATQVMFEGQQTATAIGAAHETATQAAIEQTATQVAANLTATQVAINQAATAVAATATQVSINATATAVAPLWIDDFQDNDMVSFLGTTWTPDYNNTIWSNPESTDPTLSVLLGTGGNRYLRASGGVIVDPENGPIPAINVTCPLTTSYQDLTGYTSISFVFSTSFTPNAGDTMQYLILLEDGRGVDYWSSAAFYPTSSTQTFVIPLSSITGLAQKWDIAYIRFVVTFNAVTTNTSVAGQVIIDNVQFLR